MDEGAARDAIDRAHRAKVLLADPLLTEAFDDIEQSLINSWRGSTSDRMPLREDAWRSLKLLEKLKACLEKHVATGKVAERDLLDIEKKRGIFRR